MKNLLNKFKSNLDTVRREESGDIVQTILILAVFVLIVSVVGAVLYKAITAQGDKTGKCITNIGSKVASGAKC